uniref:Citrate transporter-like domain-containing protein n=1 Tax=Chromera velia CCMP2878 TaxID=1169474 RepID=A0A0G4IFT3_9ALVE|eukprot:Cvel_2509.t1-p1 / transcript=Cvel_2509.t1 / gene=Cvel_2509 / organism=Chromera_velia_CCMP2878 / gene_product=Solute carrier family 13 member 5, putative / transcript_product=Solute carrier family 13 member 5, putative / location=Cvel_scaffold98:133017-136682(+) / protein_length=1056 / sequence_SO=supercontig / SO=protein_coding / is_pseudo=false
MKREGEAGAKLPPAVRYETGQVVKAVVGVAGVLVGFIVMGLPLVPDNDLVAKCAGVLVVMMMMWSTELLPLAVTSLIPLVFFPFLGVLSSKEVAVNYFKDVNVLLFAGFVLAKALEKVNLHKRMALWVVKKKICKSPSVMLMGFMLGCWFLSMWISNTAACVMMTTNAEALLRAMRAEKEKQDKDYDDEDDDDEVDLEGEGVELNECREMDDRDEEGGSEDSSSSASLEEIGGDVEGGVGGTTGAQHRNGARSGKMQKKVTGLTSFPTQNTLGRGLTQTMDSAYCSTANISKTFHTKKTMQRKRRKALENFEQALLLGSAYACNVGGMATLIGTLPNLVFKQQVEALFPNSPPVTFGRWASIGMPTSLVLFGVVFGVLALGLCPPSSMLTIDSERFRGQYARLGKITYDQWVVSFVAFSVAILWFSREPISFSEGVRMPGWSELLVGRKITDASVGMALCLLLAVLPNRQSLRRCEATLKACRPSRKALPEGTPKNKRVQMRRRAEEARVDAGHRDDRDNEIVEYDVGESSPAGGLDERGGWESQGSSRRVARTGGILTDLSFHQFRSSPSREAEKGTTDGMGVGGDEWEEASVEDEESAPLPASPLVRHRAVRGHSDPHLLTRSQSLPRVAPAARPRGGSSEMVSVPEAPPVLRRLHSRDRGGGRDRGRSLHRDSGAACSTCGRGEDPAERSSLVRSSSDLSPTTLRHRSLTNCTMQGSVHTRPPSPVPLQRRQGKEGGKPGRPCPPPNLSTERLDFSPADPHTEADEEDDRIDLEAGGCPPTLQVPDFRGHAVDVGEVEDGTERGEEDGDRGMLSSRGEVSSRDPSILFDGDRKSPSGSGSVSGDGEGGKRGEGEDIDTAEDSWGIIGLPEFVSIKWDLILLMGGGFALAEGVRASGFGAWMAALLGSIMTGFSWWGVMLVSLLVVSFLTEFTSNTATAMTFLPVMGSLACSIGVSPILLMLPVALKVSTAFVLPVATPPNLIVFSTGRVNLSVMVKFGILLTVLSGVVIALFGVFVFPRLYPEGPWVAQDCGALMGRDFAPAQSDVFATHSEE